MKRLQLCTLFAVVMFVAGLVSLVTAMDVGAIGLKVAPLEYKSNLNESGTKQGFIDISNPTGQAVTIRTSVQGFKQIDNSGGLQFFDDEKISAAIKPDLTDFQLGPREALRMTFTIDGKILPDGDVYAALLFTTNPVKVQNGVGQLVRVGTLLSLVNKNPGDRSAVITDLSMPFIQLDEKVVGTYSVKNTAPEGTGFYPSVTVSSWPAGNTKQVESSLVFGGRERSNDFTYNAGYGIRRIDVSFGASKQSRWVVLVAPWMLVVGLLVFVIIVIEFLLLKNRRKLRRIKS